ncbi:unnamed protein product [Miscanthus lutarioriparius]|uniref:Uncharacterized protein n=1 Tax=Miscanthus lutarioriparius TaxID=422564 RepID=A0A811RMV4_9POAL|nr:unnamed protein product [Miscanthus lutarioriparius]
MPALPHSGPSELAAPPFSELASACRRPRTLKSNQAGVRPPPWTTTTDGLRARPPPTSVRPATGTRTSSGRKSQQARRLRVRNRLGAVVWHAGARASSAQCERARGGRGWPGREALAAGSVVEADETDATHLA